MGETNVQLMILVGDIAFFTLQVASIMDAGRIES